MNRFRILLLLSFVGSVASVFASRGVYFYTFREFGFTDGPNLWLALGTGIAYILGAVPSHALASRHGERRVLLVAIVCQVVCMGVMFLFPTPAVIVSGQIVFSWFNALMWPIVESYVSAGRSPRDTAKALGQFNVTWALAVPLSILITGPIIADVQAGLFGIGAVMMIAVGLMAGQLNPAVAHMAHDHPDRPPADRLARCAALLGASRWLLAYTYALFFLLTPLFPMLYDRLGFDVQGKTAMASIVDFSRWCTFVIMMRFAGWRDRASILWLSLALLPASFLIVLLVPHTATIIAAQIIFGIAAGLVYFAAIYYAMVVKNAAVDAGGAHEGLIGVGYSLGPIAGLIGLSIAGLEWTSSAPAMLAGIGPLVVICTLGAAWPLLKLGRMKLDR